MEVINKIKKLLFGEDMAGATPPPAAPTTTEYKTKDGAVISIDKLDIGGIATLDGTPLSDGSYTLEDGTTFTVLQGLISEVETAKQTATEPIDEMNKQVAAMQTQIDELKKERELLKEKFAAQTEANKLIVETLEKFAEKTVEVPKDQSQAIYSEHFRKVLESRGKI